MEPWPVVTCLWLPHVCAVCIYTRSKVEINHLFLLSADVGLCVCEREREEVEGEGGRERDCVRMFVCVFLQDTGRRRKKTV